MSTAPHRLIVLDRDGVINEDSDDYVKSPDEWIPIPGSLEAIARLTHAGFDIAIATNQSGIGRGLYTLDALHAMHDKMLELLGPLGGRIDGIFYCPHAPEANCECRKPKPGLFRQIAESFGRKDLQGVPIVGDTRRDLEAGMALSGEPWLVLTGKGASTFANGVPEGTRVRPSLAAIARELAP
ncbi:MAG TPA: D-glycero-beta-D-manno-heptose 1,7-bisphosphate 7-phosphatase [Burkholderiaceae bacterium]|nr:D-glycero-beta-D-manno-heptose 1,7-bisphosphate 7-phosphatase [Burkholderiaceae bacterium]